MTIQEIIDRYAVWCDTVYGRMHILSTDTPRGRCLIDTGKAPDHEDIVMLCDLVAKCDKHCRDVIDVGANFGTHTLAFSRVAKWVVALEPQVVIRELLHHSVCENDFAENVSVMDGGAGGRYDTMAMPSVDYSAPGDFGSVRVISGDAGKRLVPVRPLSEIINRGTGLVKIDVEGMEREVLRGMRLPYLDHLPILFVEYIHVDRKALEEDLRDMGYTSIVEWGMNLLCRP